MRRARLERGRRLRSMSAKRRASGMGRRDDPVYLAVDRRSGMRCEVVLDGIRCRRPQEDRHHLRRPRSSPESHIPSLIVGVCRHHHERAEAAYRSGRLVVTPHGDGTFTFAVIEKPSKFAPDPEAVA